MAIDEKCIMLKNTTVLAEIDEVLTLIDTDLTCLNKVFFFVEMNAENSNTASVLVK